MYTAGIIEYLIWPAFILIVWFIVRFALAAYEKKFPGKELPVSEKPLDK
jgi:hypothetical protein